MNYIEKEYTSLAKKHKLPDYKKVNNEFEISNLEEDEFVLRNVRRKIGEKLDFFVKQIEVILQPENTFTNLYECKAFSEEEKDKLLNILQKLMQHIRASLVVHALSDDKQDAKFISDVMKDWDKIKKDLTGFSVKLKKAWEKETGFKQEVEYLG